MLVFVYGTLMRGEGNHRYLEGSRFKGEAVMTGNFRMHNLGSYPAVIETGDEPGEIHGELYEIDRNILADLDILEGVAGGLYYRRKEHVQVLTPRGWTRATAWVYMMEADRIKSYLSVILGGDWRERGRMDLLGAKCRHEATEAV